MGYSYGDRCAARLGGSLCDGSAVARPGCLPLAGVEAAHPHSAYCRSALQTSTPQAGREAVAIAVAHSFSYGLLPIIQDCVLDAPHRAPRQGLRLTHPKIDGTKRPRPPVGAFPLPRTVNASSPPSPPPPSNL